MVLRYLSSRPCTWFTKLWSRIRCPWLCHPPWCPRPRGRKQSALPWCPFCRRPPPTKTVAPPTKRRRPSPQPFRWSRPSVVFLCELPPLSPPRGLVSDLRTVSAHAHTGLSFSFHSFFFSLPVGRVACGQGQVRWAVRENGQWHGRTGVRARGARYLPENRPSICHPGTHLVRLTWTFTHTLAHLHTHTQSTDAHAYLNIHSLTHLHTHTEHGCSCLPEHSLTHTPAHTHRARMLMLTWTFTHTPAHTHRARDANAYLNIHSHTCTHTHTQGRDANAYLNIHSLTHLHTHTHTHRAGMLMLTWTFTHSHTCTHTLEQGC